MYSGCQQSVFEEIIAIAQSSRSSQDFTTVNANSTNFTSRSRVVTSAMDLSWDEDNLEEEDVKRYIYGESPRARNST